MPKQCHAAGCGAVQNRTDDLFQTGGVFSTVNDQNFQAVRGLGVLCEAARRS
jgi:hypothetical protein